MVAEGKLKALHAIAIKSAIAITAISLVLILMVWAFGDKLVELGLGVGFEGSSYLAILLLFAATLTGAAIPFITVFYVLLKPGRAAWIRAAAIPIYVLVFFATRDEAGLNAAGWAALLSAGFVLVVTTLWASYTLKRHETKT